jgi:tetratricopeptide (TPR) repeat protein
LTVLLDQGVTAADAGDHREAIACFDRVLEQDPASVPALVHKGDALRHLGRYEEAIGFYDQAIAIDPRYSDGMAWGHKGIALNELDPPDEASRCCEEVLNINPGDATACLNLGVVHHDEGRLEEAARWYREALERDPRHGRAKAYLAELLGGDGVDED